MGERFVLRQTDRVIGEGVSLAEHTHIVLLEQAALKKTSGQTWQQTNSHVHEARSHVLIQIARGVSQSADLDARC